MANKKALSLVFESQQFTLMEVRHGATHFEPIDLQSYSFDDNTLVQHLENRGGSVYNQKALVVGVLNHSYYQLFQLNRPPSHITDLKEWVAVQLGEKVAFPINEVVFEIFESAIPAYVFVIALHQPVVSSLVAQMNESPCRVKKLLPVELALTNALTYVYPEKQKIAYLYVEDRALKMVLLVNGKLVAACVLLNHLSVEKVDGALVVNTILLNVESALNKFKQQDIVLAGGEFSFCYSCGDEYQGLFDSIGKELPTFTLLNVGDIMGLESAKHYGDSAHCLVALGGVINAVH
jgi:hypothetical protein